MTQTSDSSATHQRQCENCHGAISQHAKICSQCGIPCPPERNARNTWHGISFPMFVVLVSIFCLLMILWLPR